MKILYIDVSLRGHRTKYLEALASTNESVLLLPEKHEPLANTQYVMTSNYNKKRSILTYWRWIQEINEIVRKEKIDIVHFLCGDSLYRYFGLFLKSIPTKIIVTYHHMLFSRIRQISMKHIFAASYGIVHTDALLEGLSACGIKNASKIEYPVFLQEISVSKHDAKEKLGLPLDKPCITIFGGTQRYKGLDILLEALNDVSASFQLYITGVERDFSADYILEHSKKYANSVKLHMKRLSDEEYAEAMAATDFLVLPYRYEFDGASGPMIEGVWNRKYIIGASHGSMGAIIKKHKLGSIFKTEDPHDLAFVLNSTLRCLPEWSNEAEHFREELTIYKFIDRYKAIYKLINV